MVLNSCLFFCFSRQGSVELRFCSIEDRKLFFSLLKISSIKRSLGYSYSCYKDIKKVMFLHDLFCLYFFAYGTFVGQGV